MSGDLIARLNSLADRLVPVAGYLMSVATSNGRCAAKPDEHDEGCGCQCCRAFVATQSAITELSKIIHELHEEDRPAHPAVQRARAAEAFKVWVHNYLDAQGVPHHPPGTHGAEGCRIGDRLDWLMARLRRAEGGGK